MRLLFVLALCGAAPAVGQDVPPPHRLPFGTSGNAIELALGGASSSPDALTVTVASAPSWLSFDADRAAAVVPEAGGEAVARFAFAVAPTAPVGVPADVVLHRAGAERVCNVCWAELDKSFMQWVSSRCANPRYFVCSCSVFLS